MYTTAWFGEFTISFCASYDQTNAMAVAVGERSKLAAQSSVGKMRRRPATGTVSRSGIFPAC